MVIKLGILLIGVNVFLMGCNSNLCGELTPSLKNKIITANNRYGDIVHLEIIPCEVRYINIYLKTKNYNDTIFNNIHKVLYDKTNKDGWSTLFIFDCDRRYLFSHSSNNKLYKQSGD